MKEAFRLLNKSIIRVETPDVNLDQEEEAQMEVDEGPDGINSELFVLLSILGLETKMFFKMSQYISVHSMITNVM